MSHLCFTSDCLKKWVDWTERNIINCCYVPSIVVVGRSGMLVGLPIAYNRERRLIVLPQMRKSIISEDDRPQQTSISINDHLFQQFDSNEDIGEYIFIDDYISSGETLRQVLNTIRGECKGVLIYDGIHDSIIEEIKELGIPVFSPALEMANV